MLIAIAAAVGCSSSASAPPAFNDSAFGPNNGILVALHGPAGDCLGFVTERGVPALVVSVTPGYQVQTQPPEIVTSNGAQIAVVGQSIFAETVGQVPLRTGCGKGRRRIVLEGSSVIVHRKPLNLPTFHGSE
jgi:hypothetical protein